MDNKINNIIEDEIKIEGSGDSKERAISNALTQIQKKIMAKTKKIILRIEPVEVEAITLQKKIATEHFLFFLFPRKTVQYSVELKVKVRINYLTIIENDFLVEEKSKNKFPDFLKQLGRN
ncbi:MAG: DUF4312 family protein [Liquorilactobacillus ghanensis]|uniref:DUF4312 family protein n=1 Tax=Liquorilactobacillus ghanensis TaxID=399370 RepID=UPI0039E7D6A1